MSVVITPKEATQLSSALVMLLHSNQTAEDWYGLQRNKHLFRDDFNETDYKGLEFALQFVNFDVARTELDSLIKKAESTSEDGQDLSDALLLVDDAQGIYSYQAFANLFGDYIRDEGDKEILQKGPDHEYYLDAWEAVKSDANPIMINNKPYQIYEDSGIWGIPDIQKVPNEPTYNEPTEYSIQVNSKGMQITNSVWFIGFSFLVCSASTVAVISYYAESDDEDSDATEIEPLITDAVRKTLNDETLNVVFAQHANEAE